jgi:hypothetical protein
MRDDAKNKRLTDMALYYNLTTFDIIGDLSFGESFGGLKSGIPHLWMKAFFDFLKPSTCLMQLMTIPVIGWLVPILALPLLRKGIFMVGFTREKIAKRMEQATTRPDFMAYVLKHNEEKGLSEKEILADFGILMIGSCSSTYYCTVRPALMFVLLKLDRRQQRRCCPDVHSCSRKTRKSYKSSNMRSGTLSETTRISVSVRCGYNCSS